MANCKRSHEIVVATLVVMVFWTLPAREAECGSLQVESVLRSFAENYEEVAGDSAMLIVQLEISPGGSWYVSSLPGGKVELQDGIHQGAAFTIRMSSETLDRLYQGTMAAFTAGAKATGADSVPLELEVHDSAQDLPDPKGTMLGFLQHFFVSSRPERILLREEYSRIVHGAHVIPLYYATGFRSAWYKVKHGQQLNEPGDTNPFPQALIVISGRGRAKIGDVEIEVQAGESYYIPPNSDHVVWPEKGQDLEIIWLAWGEEA